ncbi:hypothetical protein WAI453_000526 [Rhynchosporium graminicola]
MISNSVEALLALYACTKQLRFIQPAATQQSINCPTTQRLSDPAIQRPSESVQVFQNYSWQEDDSQAAVW